ncbi:hypothetical protein FOMPIDRAFT_64580, partial [Fomitopsis schrenkii]
MEHILVECDAYGQRAVWALAKSLWLAKGLPWKDVSFEDIMGLGVTAIHAAGARTTGPQARLWRILISEGAHLVWRLRCERVIGHAAEDGWTHTAKTVTTKWLRSMN